MSETPLLGLPILEAAQAQKHVTHNEALLLLDAAIQLSVISRAVATPPLMSADGDRYLVGTSSTGLWTGQAGKLAIRQGGAWLFATPRKGWRVWIEDEESFLVYDGLAWRDLSVSGGDKGDVQIGAGGTWHAERSGGAIGNGIADDTAALQSVLTAGKSVILNSAKTYRITQRLDITAAGTGIEGNGARIVMSTAAGHFDNGLYANRYNANAVAIRASDLTGVFVRNLRIAPDAWVDLRYLKAVYLQRCNRLTVSGLEAWNFSRSSGVITLNDCTGGDLAGNHIHDCWTNAVTGSPAEAAEAQITGICVDPDAATGTSEILISGCRFINLTMVSAAVAAIGYQTDGVNLQGNQNKPTENCRIVHNVFYNLGEGIDIFGNDNIVAHNQLERCFNRAVKLIHGASRNDIAFNQIRDGGFGGIVVSGSMNPGVGNTDSNRLRFNVIQSMGIAGNWLNADGGLSFDASGGAAYAANTTHGIDLFDGVNNVLWKVANTIVEGNDIDLGGTGKVGVRAGSYLGPSPTNLCHNNRIRNFTQNEIVDQFGGLMLRLPMQSPALTLQGNNTGVADYRRDLTAAQVRTMLAVAGLGGDVTDDGSGNPLLLARHDMLNGAFNGNFELGDFGWVKQTGWAIQNDPANARGGNWVAINTLSTGAASELRTSNRKSVRPGDTVFAESWFKTSAGAVITIARTMILWLTKDGATIAQVNAANQTAEQPSYVQSALTAVAPANAAFYITGFQVAKTAGNLWVDDFFDFRRRDAANILLGSSVNTALLGGDVTAAGKSLLTAANAAAQRAVLEIGGSPWTALTAVLPGGSGTQDFGMTVMDAACSLTSVIQIQTAPTLDTDENEPEFTTLEAMAVRPGNGSYSLSLAFTEHHSGPLKLQYRIN